MKGVRLGVLSTALLSACAAAQPDVPAVIHGPTKDSRAELAQAVSSALNGAPVTIADDALTRDSVLIIERARARGPGGVLASGRELDKPEHFRLVKNGRRCVLVHERTGKRTTLASTTCQPVVP